MLQADGAVWQKTGRRERIGQAVQKKLHKKLSLVTFGNEKADSCCACLGSAETSTLFLLETYCKNRNGVLYYVVGTTFPGRSRITFYYIMWIMSLAVGWRLFYRMWCMRSIRRRCSCPVEMM